MESCQRLFHQRWGHLEDRCVRDLAWLLDAPDLLDQDAVQWQGKIAVLPKDISRETAAWLAQLDARPAALHAFLDMDRTPRVGRYAEKLLAFFFREQGQLAAHGLQVRQEPGNTVGEFDYLLHTGTDGQLVHRELATKFYLLAADYRDAGADYFMGPNLADSLHAKMQKILGRQLALAEHPAALAVVPGNVLSAQAFVKGWLFWPGDALPSVEACARAGISTKHCRGRWMSLLEWAPKYSLRFRILPRLHWLSPAMAQEDEVYDAEEMRRALHLHFERDCLPVMVAACSLARPGVWLEEERMFIVPEDWRERALRVTGKRSHSETGPGSLA